MEESSYSISGNNFNYCHGNNSKNSNKSSSSKNEGLIILRKGPWKPEEDQVLINHVNKYGPRDWSSIRSKGLLQRTGKSCRLRWVNKLRPNLKIGCKFTAEEERVVIELQSQLGNKWATIATHLSGRTDNDVKNFWSSRQKRLARILRSQSQSPQPPHHKRLKSSSSSTSANSSRNRSLFVEVSKTSFEDMDAALITNNTEPTSNNTTTISNRGPTPFSTDDPVQIHESLQLEEASFPSLLRLPHETQELIERLDTSFLQTFDDPLFSDIGIHSGSDHNHVTLDSFFDDFPADMFDQIEPLPSPSRW